MDPNDDLVGQSVMPKVAPPDKYVARFQTSLAQSLVGLILGRCRDVQRGGLRPENRRAFQGPGDDGKLRVNQNMPFQQCRWWDPGLLNRLHPRGGLIFKNAFIEEASKVRNVFSRTIKHDFSR